MIFQERHRLLILALLLMLLQGCGQKGPLYLPGDPDQQENQSATNH